MTREQEKEPKRFSIFKIDDNRCLNSDETILLHINRHDEFDHARCRRIEAESAELKHAFRRHSICRLNEANSNNDDVDSHENRSLFNLFASSGQQNYDVFFFRSTFNVDDDEATFFV